MTFIHKRTFIHKKHSFKEDASLAYLALFCFAGLMDSLEKTKKSMAATNEAFKDDIVAQALIEEYVLKLFSYADAEDRAERFNKNVIKVAFESHLQH